MNEIQQECRELFKSFYVTNDATDVWFQMKGRNTLLLPLLLLFLLFLFYSVTFLQVCVLSHCWWPAQVSQLGNLIHRCIAVHRKHNVCLLYVRYYKHRCSVFSTFKHSAADHEKEPILFCHMNNDLLCFHHQQQVFSFNFEADPEFVFTIYFYHCGSDVCYVFVKT